MKITDFKALSFDCYGTLIDWETGILAALKPWLQQEGIKVSDDDILTQFGHWEHEEQADVQSAPYPEILEGVHLALARHYNIRSSKDHRKRLSTSVGDWPAFPDSAAALKVLKNKFKLIILSNVDRASFKRSNEKLGVEFDAIYTAEDIHTYKPHPRNFRYLEEHAEKDLGIKKTEILHVAQSLFHDHVPAQEAGFKTCWIDRRGTKGGGATKAPEEPITPTWTFPSMAALANSAE